VHESCVFNTIYLLSVRVKAELITALSHHSLHLAGRWQTF